MIQVGQTKLAIKKLTDILEKDDRNPYAHYLLAEAYLKEDNIQYAILEYRQVLKLGKFDTKINEIAIRKKLASMYLKRKAVEEAKKEYLILTKIDANNYENFYNLGLMHYEAGAMEKASGYFKKSLSLNSTDANSYYYLGQIMYRLNQFAEAKSMFLSALKIDQKNYKIHYFLGLVLRQLGDYVWAIKEFEVAEKSDDLKVKCYLAKGTCFYEQKQYPKAIVEFEKGLKYAKKGSNSELNLRYSLGNAYEQMRDLHSAISNWERIVEVKKNFRDVQDKLKQYIEFRQDDNIKDFMIAGLSQFEHICSKMIESMGYLILNTRIINDTEIEMVAMENEGKWRNIKKSNKIIRIIRKTDTVTDSLLRQLNESMKENNAARIVVISTGDYSQLARDYADTRPVELYTKSDLVNFLKEI